MKKIKIIAIIVLVFAGIVAVLINNRSKLEAKSNKSVIDSYPVTTDVVGRKEVSKSIELVGTITGDNDVAVVSEASGRVVSVNAKVGDYKTKGSLLIQLDGELKLAAFKTAEVNYEKVQKDFERYKALFNEKSITEARYEASKLELQAAESQYIAAKREYNDTKISAPISGVVTSRLVDEGDYVNKNNIVANVVNISKLKVKLNVAEKDAFRLNTGDAVSITTDVYPGVTFKGKIETISDQGDAAHTYPIEISLNNSKEHPLKAGMFGKVSFISLKESNSLVIPREALAGSVKDAKVYVVENGVAKEKDLVIGSAYGNMLEVLKGLKEGDKIVVNGQNNLKDNYKVIIVN